MSVWHRIPARPAPAAQPPNLLAESLTRAELAQAHAACIYERGITGWWPDPYGPDAIVFGPRYTPRAVVVPAGAVRLSCWCGARWTGTVGQVCWACGKTGSAL